VSGTLTRTALARLTRVSPDTLRHYERKGVLPAPPRSANGYRRYPPSAVTRVQLVQRALTVGFTLDELARVLKEREAGRAPCGNVRALVAERLAALDDRLIQLRRLRTELRDLLRDWDQRLEAAGPHRQARLLDGLVDRPALDRRVRAAPEQLSAARRRTGRPAP
jgi:MerR family transcriptional regulator, copper efflux regulator